MKKLVVLICFTGVVGCGMFDGLKGNKGPQAPVPNPLPKIEKTVEVKRNWAHNIGSVTGDGHVLLTPAVRGDTVYTADASGVLSAIRTDNGRTIWSTGLKTAISGGVGVGDAKVLVGTPQGKVIALSAQDGARLWEQQLSSEILAPPAAAAGVAIVRTVDGRVYGLSGVTGENKWSIRRDVPSLSLRGNSPPLLERGVAIAGFASGRVAAMDVENGRVLWDIPLGRARGRNEVERIIDIDATPVLFGSVLYVSSFQGNVTALALGSQSVLWTREISSYSDVAADQNNIYVADEQGKVIALNRLTGETLWEQDKLLQRSLSGPAVIQEYVVVGDQGGFLHVLRKDDGELVGQMQLGGAISATPIESNGILYVTTRGGKLISLSLAPAG